MTEEDRYDPSFCPLGGRCLFDGGCANNGHDRCSPPPKAAYRGRVKDLADRDDTVIDGETL